MSNTIQHKRSTTSGTTPSASDLAVGEIGINTADRTLFTKHSDGTVVSVADVASDTTPQLGGTLDAGTNAIQYSSPSPGGQQTFLGVTASGGATTPLVRTTHSPTGSRNVELTFDSSNTATTKLATTNTGISVAGNIAVTGNVDGRDVATDGTKLDGIASSATANPNAIDNIVEDTSPQLGANLDLNSFKLTQGSAGQYQRSIDTGNINCGVTNGFSMYLGYQGTYSFDITNGQFNQSFSRIAKFTSNGSCELYNIGLLKLKTNTYGIEVRGDATNGSGAIQLNCENNSHGVKIKAPPHSAAASYTLTLPNDDGTAGQVLSTDGFGGLSWITPSSGSGGSGISNVVEDTTPQLGGNLDVNSKQINGTGSILINGNIASTGGTYGNLTWSHANGTLHLGDDSWLGMGSTSSTPDVVLVANPAHGGYTFQIMDRNYSNPTIAIGIDPSAGQAVFYNGVKKFETTSAGVTVTGALTATGDVTAFSDARLKENVETIDNALEKVCGLRGVSYEKDGKKGIGVIAQEVEEVIPEVVGTHDDKDATRTVAYGNMVGVLIEAIKEQQQQIEELKAKVTELGGYE